MSISSSVSVRAGSRHAIRKSLTCACAGPVSIVSLRMTTSSRTSSIASPAIPGALSTRSWPLARSMALASNVI